MGTGRRTLGLSAAPPFFCARWRRSNMEWWSASKTKTIYTKFLYKAITPPLHHSITPSLSLRLESSSAHQREDHEQ
jgi:hypothetical protein